MFGFIREKISTWQDIPREIIFVCVLFYGNGSDEWDPNYVSEAMTLSDKTVAHGDPTGNKNYNALASAYCKYIHESGIFKWKFKMENGQREYNNYAECMIGIWNSKHEKPQLDTYFTDKGQGYGYCPKLQEITNEDGYTSGITYGPEDRCKNDSIIEMVLDLDALTLSYSVNNIDYGKAFDVEPGNYRAAVYLHRGGISVTILDD